MQPTTVRVGSAPAMPPPLLPLLRRLKDRLDRVVNEVNPDALPGAVRRELRMFRQLMLEEHGCDLDWVSATLETGRGPGERYEVP